MPADDQTSEIFGTDIGAHSRPIGICGDLLMRRAFGVDDNAATLARFSEYAGDVRIDVLIKVLEVFSAFVLAVTLYGITRDEDHELAILAMVCRVAEGMFLALSIPSYLACSPWRCPCNSPVYPQVRCTDTTSGCRPFYPKPRSRCGCLSKGSPYRRRTEPYAARCMKQWDRFDCYPYSRLRMSEMDLEVQ